MTRESLADRLVNYADAIAAFSVVNSLTFLVALTEPDIRCSLDDLRSVVVAGQVTFSIGVAAAVVVLRRLELRVRSADAPVPEDVERFLRGFFIVRLVVILASSAFTVSFAVQALTDTSCLVPAA